MWKETSVALVVLFLVATAATGAITTNDAVPENEPPLADAGLDQEVRKSATVLLDGTGSRDPDGRIETYSWSIRTPSGDTITPDCADCNRTRFTPTETGRYHVTLTVTDEGGTNSSDTLYVDVSPGTEPTISLAGPQQSTEGLTETYSANLDAGTAPLDYVVWSIDGVEIANHSLSADQSTDTAMKYFPTAGSPSITATVYDTDGQTDKTSLAVTVRQQPDQPTETGVIANKNSPTVSGDTVVTGEEPLRGHYSIQLDTTAKSVASVEWRNTAGKIGVGQSLTRDWEPGNHEVYAIVAYTDGSENVATFADGTTAVVADPRPNATFVSLDRYGSISGTASSIDEYENLDTFRVEVDGKTIAVAEHSIRLDTDYKQKVHFSSDDFTPGEQYSVTVIATDERGQTTEVSRDIVPVKEPEIVRSEFVNSPVDSYHERIDPSRYTAHHLLEIELNGADPENLEVEIQGADDPLRNVKENKVKSTNNGELFIESFWAGEIPGEYYINIELKYSTENNWGNDRNSNFQVTKSKPELRLDVLNDGTKEYITRDHGILVNASRSFDPDKTDLKYIWKYGAEPTKPDNTTAKFGSYERAASIIEDEYDLRTKRNFNFLDYFVPGIAEKEVLSDEPHNADGTVRIRVETEPYHFSKQTYYRDFSLGLSVSSSGATVTRWEAVEAPNSSHSEPTEDAYKYVGIVEVPANEFSSQSPTITVYNLNNTRKKSETSLPEVGVLLENREYWSDAAVERLTYLVEKPKIRKTTVHTISERDEFLEDGYHVENVEDDTKYFLEKYVKLQNAKYEKITKRFSSKRHRNRFLSSMPDWYAAGTTRKEETKTRTFSSWFDSSTTRSPRKWHDKSLWNGEQTGATREVKIEDAKYETEKNYRYDYEIQKTRTKRVTRCSLRFGCHKETITKTYTVTRSSTYWASSSYSYDHHFTGKTRQIKVQDAVYETQFEVRYKSQSTETVTYYEAARDKQVQKARYDWEKRASTMDYVAARKQARANSNWRIDEETVTAWTLVRNEGTSQFQTSVYTNESHVAETTALVTGTFTREFYNPKTGKITEETESRSSEFIYTGAKSREKIVGNITGEEDDTKWCEIKASCSEENGGA
jgi:hypothetical protein